MNLNSMNCLSSSSERVLADFACFSPSSTTKEEKQNTQPCHTISADSKAVQIKLRTNHEAVDCVIPGFTNLIGMCNIGEHGGSIAETDGNIGIVSKSLILILILGISISIGIDWGLF